MRNPLRLFTFSLIVSCFSAAQAEPRIVVASTHVLADERFAIRLTGFAPHSQVDVTASQTASDARVWTAHKIVRTDRRGRALIARPMRLVTRMKPPKGFAGLFTPPDLHVPIDLTIAAAGKSGAAKIVVHRAQVASGVRIRPIHEQGVDGLLFEPAGDQVRRGIVVVGGSEGSEPKRTPALLASHGFEVLSLAYFGKDGLSASLTNIPVGTVARGIAWLSSQPRVAAGGVYLEGESRGGELAILAALQSPNVRGVIALVPTPIVFAGLEFGKGPVDKSPWSVGGAPVPYLTYQTWQRYLSSHDDRLIDAAILPIENLRVPLLIVAGEDDRLAFSAVTSRIALQKARKAGLKTSVTMLAYPQAGHLIEPPYGPTANRARLTTPYGELEFGGTPVGYEIADSDSWKRMIAFLLR